MTNYEKVLETKVKTDTNTSNNVFFTEVKDKVSTLCGIAGAMRNGSVKIFWNYDLAKHKEISVEDFNRDFTILGVTS